MTVIYDFLWDDQGCSGVWVEPETPIPVENRWPAKGETLVLIEAQVVRVVNGTPWEHLDYMLPSQIELQPGEGVWSSLSPDEETDEHGIVYGEAAKAVLRRLVEIERASVQVAVNRQQVELLGADAPRTDMALDNL